MKLDELMGSLRTFEMTIDPEPKTKGIALKADVHEDLAPLDDDDMAKSIALLAKNFGKFGKYMKKLNHNPSGSTTESAPDKFHNSNRAPNPQRKPKAAETSLDQRGKSKGIQCREYEGFGHI